MILTKNSNGEWIQVAGNGKAEYGASTVRTGTITTEEISIGSFAIFTITFDTPMPDSDYHITWEWNTAGGNLTYAIVTITEKTANGFKLYVRNADATSNPITSHVLSWHAFKLYTDTEYNSLLDLPDKIEAVEDDVEAMKSETSGSATIASGLLGQVTWTKIGRLVQVRVNNIRNESGAIAGGSTICTGLPVAKSTTSFAIGRYPNEANVVDLISNGELRQTGMYSVASGIGMFGDFVYISAQ